jgi:hypothetical protein
LSLSRRRPRCAGRAGRASGLLPNDDGLAGGKVAVIDITDLPVMDASVAGRTVGDLQRGDPGSRKDPGIACRADGESGKGSVSGRSESGE